MPQAGKIRIVVCDECGIRFGAYHETVGRFCCTAHRVRWHYKQRQKAYWTQRLADDPNRAYNLERLTKLMESWAETTKQELAQTTLPCPEDDPNYRPSFAPQPNFPGLGKRGDEPPEEPELPQPKPGDDFISDF